MPTLDEVVARSSARGTVSIWLGGLDGEPWFVHQAGTEHYACSTIKVPLVLAAYREADAGRLDLDRQVPVHDDFDSQVPGHRFTMSRADDEDQQPWQRLGDEVALRWLANRAIVRSSNLATNLLLEVVGLEPVESVLRACGATDMTVGRGIEDALAMDEGRTNLVTARDLAAVLLAVARDAETIASADSLHEIRGFLAAQQFNDGIAAGVPAGTRIEHKTGSITGVSHDAGLVYPPDSPAYVLAVCTTTGAADDDATRLIAELSAAVWTERYELAGAERAPAVEQPDGASSTADR